MSEVPLYGGTTSPASEHTLSGLRGIRPHGILRGYESLNPELFPLRLEAHLIESIG